MTQPTAAPRPAIVTIAFWLVLAGSVLLLAGGLLGLSSAISTPRDAFSPELSDSEVSSIVIMRGGVSGLLLLTGLVLSFLAGRARQGDLRFRRSMVWLSAVLVALVFVLALLAPFAVTPLALFGVVPVAIGATLFMRPALGLVSGGAMTESDPSAPEVVEEVLFFEPGGTWWWLLAGPAAGAAMMFIQLSGGAGVQFGVPAAFTVLVGGFLWIQIKAARIHTSVQLTPTTLRQGTEFVTIADIVKIYPEPKRHETEKWQSYRAFGELSGIPRGRTGIGLKLTDGRSGQAWARKHRTLRAALEKLVGESTA